jgi:hypothetical protein
MKIAQLKSSLHQLVDEINDADTLRKIKNILSALTLSNEKKDWWDDLTADEKKDLEEAVAEADDEKQWTSHSEVIKMARSWLKK